MSPTLRVAVVAGCSPYERLTPARAATVLTCRLDHSRGAQHRLESSCHHQSSVTQENDPTTALLVDELVDALTPNNEVVSMNSGTC